MAKLHELLAVESDVAGQAETCRTDLKGTFASKTHHFSKRIVQEKALVDGVADRTTSQLDMQSTVGTELRWIGKHLEKKLDIGHQVDVGNTLAKADVVLDNGTVLLKDVPTTSLLRMAHRVGEIKDLVVSVPTLDPAKNFAPDPDQGVGVFRAKDETKIRPEKVFQYVVMVAPTDKFPAQVKELMVDKPIAEVVTQEWSGLITVKQKAELLDRVEDLIRAIKKARARANDIDLDIRQHVIGAKILQHVFGDLVKQDTATPAA